MNEILCCIFYHKQHYDYDAYEENCLASLKCYCPNVKVALLGSPNAQRTSFPDLVLIDGIDNEMLLLDKALEYAKNNNYKYLYLLPARVQFIRSPELFFEEAVSLLNKDTSISLISCAQLADKILPSYPLKNHWQLNDDGLTKRASTFGFCETGLVRIETLEQLPFRFGNATWQALNSWFLSQNMKAYVSTIPYSAWIPWVKEFDKKPKVNFAEQQFYLKPKGNQSSDLSWEACCEFSDAEFSYDSEYWKSSEQCTEHFLETNKVMRYSRKFIKGVLPKKWRYYLLMLCEG